MKARFQATLLALLIAGGLQAHFVPPERFHPVVESYRRAMFLLNLEPVQWQEVRADSERIANALASVSAARATAYRRVIDGAITEASAAHEHGNAPIGTNQRRVAARLVFDQSTLAMTELLIDELQKLKGSVTTGNPGGPGAPGSRAAATAHLDLARSYWAGLEHEVMSTDRPMFRAIGLSWLEMATALGSAPLLGEGAAPVDGATIEQQADRIAAYVTAAYKDFRTPAGRPMAPVPLASKTYDPRATIPTKLPPGSNINKQRPRPRQILNLVARGVDETDTPLVAFGDMAFDSSLIFGEPARSLGLSCNNCHNKSITNPQFVIPGLSKVAGGLDVSGAFFAPHANNGHFDPIDIPDLRGIRFTGPYGRNGRFASLRDFTRNVIVNEFNGAEPDPIVLDGMLAYMMEFDFLPNPMLAKDGSLTQAASESARRGEKLFERPFTQMKGMSCASCHVPSTTFIDQQRHDIGSVSGAEDHSRDRALDTPTLLSSRFTAPYFHDGSLPTLGAVVSWFQDKYRLGLDSGQLADLTAYLEAVGDGTEAVEASIDMAAPGEVQEQFFFIASWEFLRDRNKVDLADLLFRTIAQELRNEKWGLFYPAATVVAERMAQLADEATAANRAGQVEAVDASVAKFRRLYENNASLIAGEVSLGEAHANMDGTND